MTPFALRFSRPPACCSVLVMKGGAGRERVSVTSTEVTVASRPSR